MILYMVGITTTPDEPNFPYFAPILSKFRPPQVGQIRSPSVQQSVDPNLPADQTRQQQVTRPPPENPTW
jgi:hypothetical protein